MFVVNSAVTPTVNNFETNVSTSDVHSIDNFEHKNKLNNTLTSKNDKLLGEERNEKNRGRMSITTKQVAGTMEMIGQPNYLAIRSGAFLSVKPPEQSIEEDPSDFKCQVSNKYLCYVDMIVEKPAISEMRRIFTKINEEQEIISDKAIIETLRKTEEEEWDSKMRRASWRLSSKVENYELPESIRQIGIPTNLDGGAAMSIISKKIAEKLGLSIFRVKKGITIRAIDESKSDWNQFTYAQIKIPGEEWRAIILCVVMDSDETPLLLGSNDQSAYAITPSPHLRTMFIGDLKTQPLHAVNMLTQKEWKTAIKRLNEARGNLKEWKKISKYRTKVEKELTATEGTVEALDVKKAMSKSSSRVKIDKNLTAHKERTRINRERRQRSEKESKPGQGSESESEKSIENSSAEESNDEDNPENLPSKSEDIKEKNIEDNLKYQNEEAENEKLDRIGQLQDEESEGVWTGEISVGTFCRHLEYLFDQEDLNTKEKIGERVNMNQEEQTTNVRKSGIETDSESEKEDYENQEESDRLYMEYMCSDTYNSDDKDSVNDKELENEKWFEYEFYDTSPCEFLLPEDPIRCRRLTTIEDENSLGQGDEWRAKNSIISDSEIDWMNQFMFEPGRLAEIQKEERERLDNDPIMKKELEEDIAELEDECTKADVEEKENSYQWKPESFPEEYWHYVRREQRPRVRVIFEKFELPDVLAELISDIKEKLNIGGKDPRIEKFLRAQVLANLDCYGYPDPEKPPTVPGYSMPLKLTDNIPVHSKPQKFSTLESAFLQARIHEFIKNGKLRPSEGSLYNSPVCLVHYPERIKKFMMEHGDKAMEELFKPEHYKTVATFFRFTTNLRGINAKTEPYHFPIPDATDVYHYTRGSRYYSSVDFRDAFFTVALAEEDRDKTAFTTPFGRYEWCVLPMGMINSSRLYSKVTLEALKHIPRTELINYIDDSMPHSRRFLKHMEILQRMYEAMREKTMVCKIEKSHLGFNQMKSLGHIISDMGRMPDPKLVSKLLAIAPPKDLQGIRSFLGVLNFNREYIPNISHIIAALQDLTCKDPRSIEERWTDDHTKSFNAAKHALTNAPCLLTIDPTKPFTIHTDACKAGRGLGSVLLQQNHEGKWRPVAYHSTRLTEAERAHSATELEAMALVYAIRHWSPYLRLQKFTAVVDHHALIWLVTRPARTSNGRILHWIADLMEYHFDIVHRAGKLHVDADAVSRLLHYQEMAKEFSINERPIYEEEGQSCRPIEGDDLIDLQRKAEIQKDYYEFVLGLTKTYEEMIQYPDYFKMITSREFVGRVLKPKYFENDPIMNEKNDEHNAESGENEYKDSEIDKIESNNGEEEEQDEISTKSMIDEEIENNESEYGSDSTYVSNNEGSTYSSDEEIRKSVRAAPVLDIFALRAPKGDKRQIIKEPSFPIIQREMINTAPKRPRGRPKKEAHRRLLPMLEKPKSRINFDITNRSLEPYQSLLGKIFIDPNTGRPYTVTVICYNQTLKRPMAYRKCLDDNPPDPFDDHPFELLGNNGIETLVMDYQMNYVEDVRRAAVPENSWPRSEEEMLKLQKEDPNLNPIIQRLITQLGLQEVDTVERIDDRKSYRLKALGDNQYGALRLYESDKPGRMRTVLPMKLVAQVIPMYHDQQGHPGYDRTLATIRNHYYWLKMDENIQTYVNSCNYCQSYKSFNRKSKIPIQAYDAPTQPWEVIHIDLTGANLPRTKRGNQLILIAKCALTRGVEIIPVTGKHEITIAKAIMENIIFKHGTPKTLISDQGKEFVNKTIEQIGILLGMTRIKTTAFNPRSNGLAENHNRTLKSMLAQYVDAYQSDWDQYLNLCAFQYNTTVNAQTGYSPFYMIYGREASQLDDQWIEKVTESRINDLTTYTAKVIQILTNSWRIAGSKKSSEVAKFNKVPNESLPFVEYQVGDKFFRATQPSPTYRHFTELGISTKERERIEQEETNNLSSSSANRTSSSQMNNNYNSDSEASEKEKGERKKKGERRISVNFQYKWTGPYVITKKFSPVLYEAIINQVPTIVHAINMKHYYAVEALAPFIDKPQQIITPWREKIPEYLKEKTTQLPIAGELMNEIIEGNEFRPINNEDRDFERLPRNPGPTILN